MKIQPLPIEVQNALAECGRVPGWNTKRRDVRRFTLPGRYGEPCTLFVVPFAAWHYRRQLRAAEAWHRQQAQIAQLKGR